MRMNDSNFVAIYSKGVDYLRHGSIILLPKDIERQLKIEADAVQDGLHRYTQIRKYQLATDSQPGRDLMGHSLKSLADAILREQLALKAPQLRSLPTYGIPLFSIAPEKLALIT